MTSMQDEENSSSSAAPDFQEGKGNTSSTISPTNPTVESDVPRPHTVECTIGVAVTEANNLNDRAIQVDETEWSSTSLSSTTSEYKASSPAQFPTAEYCARLADEGVVRIDSEEVVLMKVNMGIERESLEETDSRNSDLEEVEQLKQTQSGTECLLSDCGYIKERDS